MTTSLSPVQISALLWRLQQKGKWGLRALLFFLLFTLCATNTCVAELESVLTLERVLDRIAKTSTWQTLIHSKNSVLYNTDPKFLLCERNCTPRVVLEKTIQLLRAKEDTLQKAKCRFPARHLFLSEQLRHTDYELQPLQCQDYEEFLVRAPADSISLVYVAENVKQPSSMMGHSLLKISGVNEEGRLVSHGVSFFTKIEGLFFPKLVVDSLFLGMPSYFGLSPYPLLLERYLGEEQRNVWEYELDIDSHTSQLIHAHLWELKDTNAKYLFTEYNCATVIFYVLGLVDRKIVETNRLWVTPLDIAKEITKNITIKQVSLHPSHAWKIRMLAQRLGSQTTERLLNSATSTDFQELISQTETEEAFLTHELIKTYGEYLNEKLLPEEDEEYRNSLRRAVSTTENLFSDIQLDISRFKNPINTPDDSQISFGYLRRRERDYFRLNVLPASHRITDDSSQYFSESSLSLAELTILFDEAANQIQLDEFIALSWASLIPWDSLTGGVSNQFQIGYTQHFDKFLNPTGALATQGGVGRAYQLTSDMLFFALLNGGIGYTEGSFYFFGYPQLGVSIEQILNSKGRIGYSYVCGQTREDRCRHEIDLSQTFYLGQVATANFNYKPMVNRTAGTAHNFSFSLSFYF